MTYTCTGCQRTVDPDLEPSPGEPRHCADCHNDAERDFAAWIARGWA